MNFGNNCWWIIILVLIIGMAGCGCNNGCGCSNGCGCG